MGADEFDASAAAAADEVGEEGMIARPNNIDLADAIWEINNRNRVSESNEALGMDDMNVLRLWQRRRVQSQEEASTDPNRLGTVGELLFGCVFGYLIGYWAFICILGRQSSRNFRAGIYIGFLLWFASQMNMTIKEQSKRVHEITSTNQFYPQNLNSTKFQAQEAYWQQRAVDLENGDGDFEDPKAERKEIQDQLQRIAQQKALIDDQKQYQQHKGGVQTSQEVIDEFEHFIHQKAALKYKLVQHTL